MSWWVRKEVHVAPYRAHCFTDDVQVMSQRVMQLCCNIGYLAIAHVFAGADFTNAVVDRVAFDEADLSNTNFTNAVITGKSGVSSKQVLKFDLRSSDAGLRSQLYITASILFSRRDDIRWHEPGWRFL